MRMRSVRIPYFRIWYSSSFIVLFTIAFILTLISPADLVYQSIKNRIIPNVFSIGGAYVLTIVLSLFIWASRIYTNRAVLREIPKAYIPIDVGEVPKAVHRMIIKQWERSAIIAWDAKPRDVREEIKSYEDTSRDRINEHPHQLHRRSGKRPKTLIPPQTALTAWGEMAHPGWSSPASEDLPNLDYHDVIVELPNLIEAKAVSVAPPDPAFANEGATEDTAAVPDARIVALLQRPPTMGLRDYLSHLSSLGLVNPPSLAPSFLMQYEYARFSSTPLTEPQFRHLMSAFAALLSGMTDLDLDIISMLLASPSSSAASTTSSIRRAYLSSQPPSTESLVHNGLRPPLPRHQSSTGTVVTAPSRARTSWNDVDGRSLESIHSFTRTRTNMSGSSLSASASLRSARSVIRLTPSPHDPRELPYQFDIPGD